MIAAPEIIPSECSHAMTSDQRGEIAERWFGIPYSDRPYLRPDDQPLTPAAREILGILRFFWEKTNEAFPSNARFLAMIYKGAACWTRKETVRRALRELERRGYVKRHYERTPVGRLRRRITPGPAEGEYWHREIDRKRKRLESAVKRLCARNKDGRLRFTYDRRRKLLLEQAKESGASEELLHQLDTLPLVDEAQKKPDKRRLPTLSATRRKRAAERPRGVEEAIELRRNPTHNANFDPAMTQAAERVGGVPIERGKSPLVLDEQQSQRNRAGALALLEGLRRVREAADT
jgi:hypothetical protein